MSKFKFFLIIGALSIVYGCSTVGNKKEDLQLKFLVLSDIHVSNNESHEIRLNEFVKKFNSDSVLNSNIDFIATTGDNVSYIYSKRNLNRDSLGNNKLRSYINAMKKLDAPFHIAMGNHEYKIDKERDSDGYFPESEILEMEDIWEKETGYKAYYSIKKNGYNLIFLNSMRGRYQDKFFGDIQVEWLRIEIENSEKIMLFFHHPMRTDNIEHWYKKRKGTMTTKTEPEFYELISKNQDKIKCVFVGHGHKWMNDKLFGEIDVYETASFGDHEDFMYYTVEVFEDTLKVVKSKDQPFFEGFTKFKD